MEKEHNLCFPPKTPIQNTSTSLRHCTKQTRLTTLVKYLRVVVFASFECFIYESHTEVPLEPWGGRRRGTRLFSRRRLLSGRNRKFTHINIDSIIYMQNTVFLSGCLTCLHLILCVSFSSDLSPGLDLSFPSHLCRLTSALVPSAVPALFLSLCPCVLY